jgi:hypothetical protein
MDEVVKRLHAEFTEPIKEVLKTQSNGYAPQDNKKRSIIMIFDHYDEVDDLNGRGLGTLALSEIGKGDNLHFVIGGSQDIMKNSSDKLRKRAESCRYTLVLQDAEALRYMGVRDRFAIKKELPPGRGFMVKAVQASLTQICLPVLDGIDGTTPDEQLGELISGIQKKYRKSAQWSYQAKDLSILDTAIRATTEPSDAGSSYAAPAASAEPSAAMADLEKLLAEQAKMKSKKTTGSKGTAAKKKTATKASPSKSSGTKAASKSTSSPAARKTGTAAKKTTAKK